MALVCGLMNTCGACVCCSRGSDADGLSPDIETAQVQVKLRLVVCMYMRRLVELVT